MDELWKWALGGIGTVIVGLVGLWVNNKFGPKKKPKDSYPGLDLVHWKARLREKVHSTPEELTAAMAILITGHFNQWVLEHGKTGVHYRHKIKLDPPSAVQELLTFVGPKYTDERGQVSRNLRSSWRINDKWVQQPHRVARIVNGEWVHGEELE